ncbi:1-deoxy-D-xylulose-5-phosphate synthase N-terminal domain-containing protein [soil metagenome]
MVQPLTVDDLRTEDARERLTPPLSPDELAVLDEVQRRLLWLSTLIVHHANNVREKRDGLKVGGHQASSASVVSIMTALYFHSLRSGDRVSVKPHASPVFHAVQYLLGNLEQEYLTELRAYGGLQSYPSRTKDPDPVDFSTGSVGLGAVAPNFAALGHLYSQKHFGDVTSRRFISLVGDAELDEGNVWEAMIEEALKPVSNILWIVDLNRQSLDRVIPGIRASELKEHFANSGWRVLEAKYGRELRAIFQQPGGDALRRAIDDMENEEYQGLIRLEGADLREQITHRDGGLNQDIARALADVPDEVLPGLISNLGGHDLQDLIDMIEEGLRPASKPAILFAYTIKGWHMPFYGDALNHSALLNDAQMGPFRESLGIPEGQDWDRFDPDSPAGRLCQQAFERIYAEEIEVAPQVTVDQIPEHIGHNRLPSTSTQESFGRLLTQLADVEAVGERIITTSPDVSISTNLGGWINKVGVFRPEPAPIYFNAPRQLLRWEPAPDGQHIELGISEMNLFMFLGSLGLSHELSGQLLFPIGTVYDPFICRGLDALIYGCYQGSKFIFAGTPAGISLAPEGGAHQSTITPSIGLELPNLRSHEPAFAQELEWLILDGLRQCADREKGKSTYLRLSTKPIDQRLMQPALDRLGQDELRRQVLTGGYRLVDARHDAEAQVDPRDTVQIVASGVMIPEAVEAARTLHEEGVAANVINLTSPQLVYEDWRDWQRDQMRGNRDTAAGSRITDLIPANERSAPIVTVQDGASHSLAWIGSVYGARLFALGVDDFGQSGDIPSLYHHFEMDAEHIASTAFAILDLR